MGYMISRYFGLRAFGTAFGHAFGAYMLSGAAGVLLMGEGFDRFHSYTVPLAGFCGAMVLRWPCSPALAHTPTESKRKQPSRSTPFKCPAKHKPSTIQSLAEPKESHDPASPLQSSTGNTVARERRTHSPSDLVCRGKIRRGGPTQRLLLGTPPPNSPAQLKVNGDALYRTLRLLASQGVFEENNARCFRNNEVSNFLRTGVPGSLRSLFIFWGSDFHFPSFGHIMHSIQTGESSRTLLSGTDGFEHLRRDPEQARIFDDAMTTMSQLAGPAIATAYDYGAWESLMDVGGGYAILLSHILRAHPILRGVLADQEHVLARACEHGYLGGDLAARTSMEPCNFFEHVPPSCRAYLMKSVIHDWDDDQARIILANCRKAIPPDGVLLLAEWELRGENVPSNGKFIDIAMLLITGGRERSVEEYRELLASTGFNLPLISHSDRISIRSD